MTCEWEVMMPISRVMDGWSNRNTWLKLHIEASSGEAAIDMVVAWINARPGGWMVMTDGPTDWEGIPLVTAKKRKAGKRRLSCDL